MSLVFNNRVFLIFMSCCITDFFPLSLIVVLLAHPTVLEKGFAMKTEMENMPAYVMIPLMTLQDVGASRNWFILWRDMLPFMF